MDSNDIKIERGCFKVIEIRYAGQSYNNLIVYTSFLHHIKGKKRKHRFFLMNQKAVSKKLGESREKAFEEVEEFFRAKIVEAFRIGKVVTASNSTYTLEKPYQGTIILEHPKGKRIDKTVKTHSEEKWEGMEISKR